MSWIIAAAIGMFSATAWGEEVLYCTEKDSTGFYWIKGATEGEWTGFKPSCNIVNIISETKRAITPTTGDVKGSSRGYSCHRPEAWRSTSYDEELRSLSRRIVCDTGRADPTWIFHDDTFVRALLSGPPAGGADPKIVVSYGTCAK